MELPHAPIDQEKLITIRKCPACGSEVSMLCFKKMGYNFVSCGVCSLLYVNPRPNEEALESLYDGTFFEGAVEVAGRVTKNYLEGLVSYEARSRVTLARIERFIRTGRLLDVGCGLGFLLSAAEEHKWAVEGVDVSDYAVEACRKQNLRVSKNTLNNVPYKADYFDVIVAQDVLEHLFDPQAFIDRARYLLRPGGLIVLEMPNNNSLPARKNGPSWIEYIPPVHLNFFNRHSLERLLTENGFTIAIMETELSISIGLRDLLHSVSRRLRRGHISRGIDLVDRAITYFKKDVFYPPVNSLLRSVGTEGDLLAVVAVKQ